MFYQISNIISVSFTKRVIYKKESIEELIRTILSISQLIETKTKLDIVKVDPKDNIILEVAFDGKVDYIVTGDPDLLVLKEFTGIKIVKANKFLDMVK